jgi:hypothetical protein
MLDGRGNIRSIQGTNPAAGVEVSEAPPNNAYWRVQTVRMSVVGGGAVFDPSWTITDGSNIKWDALLPQIGAAATRNLLLERNGFEASFSTGYDGRGNWRTRLPEIDLPQTFVIATEDTTADDDYASPELVVEEWLVE